MSKATLATLSIAQLVALYNSKAEKSVKTFGTKTIALTRVEKLANELGLVFNGDVEKPALVKPQPEVADHVKGQLAKIADKPKKAKKAKAEKTPAQRSEYAESAVITIIETPTAREETHRAARYAKLRNGMTVGQYLTAAHKANGERRPRHRYHADIRRLVAAGNIKVEG